MPNLFRYMSGSNISCIEVPMPKYFILEKNILFCIINIFARHLLKRDAVHAIITNESPKRREETSPETSQRSQPAADCMPTAQTQTHHAYVR